MQSHRSLSILLIGTSALVFAAAAHADDDDGLGVTLYGTIDMGVMSTHTSGKGSSSGTSTGLETGGQTDSLWGLKGGEDLGQGWRANFGLVSGFDATNGTEDSQGTLFDYGAWVGLSNKDDGDLRFGRQYTIGQTFGGQLQVAGWKDTGMGATFKASDNYQNANTINYYSPTWDGWQLGIGYSFDADGEGNFETNDNNRVISSGVTYQKGPLLGVLTYEQMSLGDPSSTGGHKPSALQAGFSYDFEVVKINMAYSLQKNGYVGLDGGDPDDTGIGLGPTEFAHGGTVNTWLVGATIPVSANGNVLVQWSLAHPNWDWNDGSHARNAQVASLGYVYNLSARTSVYAFGAYMSNYTIDNQFDPDNSHTSRFGVGITHNF